MTSGAHSGDASRPLKSRLRDRSRSLLASLPFVARKRLRKCVDERDLARAALAEQRQEFQQQLQELRNALLELPRNLASHARIEWLKPQATARPAGELCLFVTHAPRPQLKRHVVDHVCELLAAGIAVVLIVNTELPADLIELPPTLLSGLHGCIVRQNVGFDFGAWAHACTLIDTGGIERLFLVNDSIVGPLDRAAFAAMLARLRGLDADFIGLTQNPYPQWHLQSFFLVVNRRLLAAPVFMDLMRHIVNLPSKEAVINTYEIQVSGFLVAQGFRCVPVFANLEPGSPLPDDTYFRWSALVDSGFPYVKASILRQVHDLPEASERVPLRYREVVTAGG